MESPAISPPRALARSGVALLLIRAPKSVQPRIDAVARAHARAIDLRAGVAWLEVLDAEACLRALVAAMEPAERAEARVALAGPNATIDQLMMAALEAQDLAELDRSFEQADMISDPPSYDVHYQPIVRLDTGTVIGFESLVRATIGGEALGTEELLDRAVAGGWDAEFDQLGRTLALRGLGAWLDDGLLFVNLMAPGGRFDLDAIEATVEAAVVAGLATDQLVFELLERNEYPDLDVVAEQVEAMRALGVRIALDDVGEGHGDLRLMAALRPDIVKLSGSLVRHLPDPTSASIVRTVTEFAHGSGVWVVAENVETSAQAEALEALGVDWAQGRFLGAPAPQSDAR